MSQTMAKPARPFLIQDVVLPTPRTWIYSSANIAKCQTCGKGLEDGYAIRAKSIGGRVFLFCDVHY